MRRSRPGGSASSRVLVWDAKWAYFEHRLVKANGDIVLLLVNRGLFWKRGTRAMPIAAVIASCGFVDLVPPALPFWVQTWSRSLDEARAAPEGGSRRRRLRTGSSAAGR